MRRIFAPPIISGFFALLLVVGIGQSWAAHSAFVAQHPFNLAWIFLSALLAGLWLLVNRESVRPLGPSRGFGYGVAGCLLAFIIQGAVNGGLLDLLGHDGPGLAGYLLLGAGAGLCQLFGKWLGLFVLLHQAQVRNRVEVIALGLGVGLGFALAEIVVIGQGMIARLTALDPPALLSLLERFSAGGFHVYSGALIAIAIVTRRLHWILWVFLLHTLVDWLAGKHRGTRCNYPRSGLKSSSWLSLPLYFSFMTELGTRWQTPCPPRQSTGPRTRPCHRGLDVQFVMMPYADSPRPSLALGLLQAALGARRNSMHDHLCQPALRRDPGMGLARRLPSRATSRGVDIFPSGVP